MLRRLAPSLGLVLSYEALADNVSADDLLGPMLDAVPMPDPPLRGLDAVPVGQPWQSARR